MTHVLVRRAALAVGVAGAFLGSQLPEYTQQYRQRLGGAIDELSAQVATFDAQADAEGLTRAAGIARLQGNGDTLARGRGEAVAAAADRADRLRRQRDALAAAGPVSQYVALAENFDPGVGRAAMGDFQPAVPATPAGAVAAGAGLAGGWLLVRLLALPMRRRPAPRPRSA